MSTKKTTTKKAPAKKAKPAKSDGRLSALDAAAKVLAESKEPRSPYFLISGDRPDSQSGAGSFSEERRTHDQNSTEPIAPRWLVSNLANL